MGVIALGIGFGDPARARRRRRPHRRARGREVARLLRRDTAARRTTRARPGTRSPASRGREPRSARRSAISLAALAGLPPSPLFVSEVLIVAGGFQAGRPWAAAVAAVLLALGFLGLAHALIETTAGRPRGRDAARAPGLRAVAALTASRSSLLLAPRRRAALWLPGRATRRRARAGARVTTAPTALPRAVAAALADGWRFAGLHATDGRRRRARRCSSTPTARPARDASRAEDGACRRSSTSHRGAAGTSARPTTSTASASTATSRCARSSTTTSPSTRWTVPVRGPTPTRSRSARSTPA